MIRVGTALSLGLVLALSGCSSRGVLSAGATPSAGPRSTTHTVAAYRTNRHLVVAPRAGQMTIRLTWSDPSVDLELYLAAASCLELYPMRVCPIGPTSKSAVGAVEEVGRRIVTAGEQYSVFVDNLDPKRGQSYKLALEVR